MSSINNKEKNFISAVVYLHNDGARAVEFCRAVAAELDSHFAQYELVVVDDACTDDTVERLRTWGKDQAAPLTILHMSLYHGLENAMNAGLDASIGDYVYEFDSTELCYPAAMIFDAYRTALQGSDIVSVCPKATRSGLFYRIFNANSHSNYQLRTDAFRLVTRRAINRVHASSAHLPYRKAAYAACGLKMTDLEFDGKVGAGAPHRFNLAIDSLALYTDAGFKASVGITLFMLALALAELVYTLVIFATGHPVAGWTTTMFVITVGFAGLFAVLAIVVKYLSLLLELTFKQQKYLVESIEKLQKNLLTYTICRHCRKNRKPGPCCCWGPCWGWRRFCVCTAPRRWTPPTMPGSGTATTRPTSTSITPGGWGSATAAGSSRWPRPMPWPTRRGRG